MQKGKLTPLALALGFAATVNGFAAEVTGPHIQTSRAFDDDTIYTVTDNGSVIGSDDTNLVEITIAAGKTLTLKNTDDNWQTRILDGSNRGGLTFTGGNLVLRMDDTSTDSNSEQCFLRATNGDATTGTTTFNTDSAVVMEGSVPQGMTFHGDINFKNGFVMNIDRSAGDAARSITAVLGQLGGTLTTTSADINITAGKNDTSITGIEFGYGGNLNAASLNLQLNGSNAQSLKVVRGINIWDHKDYPQYNQYGKDITIAGPVTITLQDVPSASSYAVILTAKRDFSFAGPTKLTVNTSNRGYGLVTNRKVDFTDDLTMDFSGNNYSWGIFANAAGQVTAKTASINMQGGNSHAIWLKENASVAIAEALKRMHITPWLAKENRPLMSKRTSSQQRDLVYQFKTKRRSSSIVQAAAKFNFQALRKWTINLKVRLCSMSVLAVLTKILTGTSLIAQSSPILQWLRKHHSISF